MRVGTISSELKSLADELAGSMKFQSETSQQIKAMAERETKMKKETELKDKEKLEMISSLNASRQARAELIEKVSAASKSLAKSGKYRAERDRSEKLRQEIQAHQISIATLNTEASMLEQKTSDISYSISERKKQIKELKSQLDEKELRREVLVKSKEGIEKELSSKGDSSRKLIDRQNAINTEMNRLSMDIGKLDAEMANFERTINDLRLKKATAETRLNDITAELSTSAYQVAGLTLLKGKPEEMDSEANILKSKMDDMGAVNLKAPEVYVEMKKQTEEAISKVTTLQTEKEAVLGMIEQIDSKKLQTFMDMLNQVNKNFAKLYNFVFPGRATIMLEDETDPLNSGIYMKLNDGKSDIPLKSLSGGQKSMVALMLLFSIHLCKKSSLYLFDEVDAALDPDNAKILSKLIKQMSDVAQFIVISHNNSLIVNADTAIGVAMDERKESKAYGVEIESMLKGKQQ
jgi:chromosome segregation protein